MNEKNGLGFFAGFKRISALAVLTVLCIGWAQAQGPEAKTNEDNFIKLYPGVYTEKEKALIDQFIATNKAIEDRGQVDAKALVSGTLPKDTPGIGPTLKVTESMAHYYNEKYDPENPLRVDADYARKAGYQDILVYPTYAAHDDSFMVPYPPKARDTLLVSDLIHSVTMYKPIYPGDTLYFVMNSRHFTDITPPEGSIYRSAAIVNQGSVYNQRAEKVLDVTYTVQENIKIYKEGLAPSNPTFSDVWEERGRSTSSAAGKGNAKSGDKKAAAGGPGGGGPGGALYYYTDKDWKLIKDIWSKEKRQGSAPLYWEDVKIGDMPTMTLEGPEDKAPSVAVPWGMGLGGSKTIKQQVMDPAIFKTLVRCEKDGIYRSTNVADFIPPLPKDATSGQFGDMGKMDAVLSDASGTGAALKEPSQGCAPSTAGGMMNFSRRDLVIRHLTWWMGDQGWLYNIRWGGLYTDEMNAHSSGTKLPVNPDRPGYYSKMVSDEVKQRARAGLDFGGGSAFIIAHSYVYRKYVRDGEFYVDLAWWLETTGGSDYGSGAVTIRLPSKNAK